MKRFKNVACLFLVLFGVGHFSTSANASKVDQEAEVADVVISDSEGSGRTEDSELLTIQNLDPSSDLLHEIKIQKIQFIGNKAVKTSTLRNTISTREALPSWLGFFDSSSSVNVNRLAQDVGKIRSAYLKRGYLDIRVVSQTLSFDGSGYVLIYVLEEGAPYTALPGKLINNVASIDTSEIQLSKRYGRFANMFEDFRNDIAVEQIIEAAERVPTLGYDVRFLLRKDEVNRTAGLEVTIVPAKPLVVARIQISGNVKTLEDVIRREFEYAGLRIGTMISPPAFRIATAKVYKALSRSGYIRSASIDFQVRRPQGQ